MVQMLDDAPGQAQSVEGAGAAADLIEDDQTASGGVVKDVGRLAHLHHEGALAAGQVIAGTDPREDPIAQVDARRGHGQIRTGVGEHGQQGDLSDVSALAGHVGAGDEGDLVALQIEVGVVGDESLLGHPQLQHRVTAFLDLDAPLVSNLRPVPPLDPRQLGEAGQDIQLPQCGGGFLDGLEVVEHLLAQAKEQVVLQLSGPFFGAEDLRFHDLEVLGDEALAAGHGLFADVVTRHLGEVRFGDFDVIAEHRVEADFQRRNTGAGDLVLLELGQPVLAASGRRAEFV